jgi:hypothetical protein
MRGPLAADYCIGIDAALRPLRDSIGTHALLFCGFGGFEDFSRVPVA